MSFLCAMPSKRSGDWQGKPKALADRWGRVLERLREDPLAHPPPKVVSAQHFPGTEAPQKVSLVSCPLDSRIKVAI